ncbi:acetyltransferase [Idiomarina sp. HP20-50]|uniref:acetyltransferase n=1 Tax=Idiomarina sp. HP20-50 TaxID=3070813 RepID=UPI00294AFF4A|nr:acetyltransferase [Idiomarina sp. HP20-50]MDV6316963.1 acetyltransferase [Idiomarina sp. HP20-50]
MNKLIKDEAGKTILAGVFGAGGFAREVMPIFKQTISKMLKEDLKETSVELVFVDESTDVETINGYRVISETEFFDKPVSKKFFSVAIGNAQLRESVTKKCDEHGALAVTLISDDSRIGESSDIGVGAIFCGNTLVTENVTIGKSFHANIYSYVAHDCVIGDYVTFAPRVNCNGNVHIEDRAYIGTGAIIKQGNDESPLVIGEGAIVGMGAVVTKSVLPNTTVVGNPARPLER